MTKIRKRSRQGLRPSAATAASAVLHALFAEMDRHDFVMSALAKRIPCHMQTISRWRHGGTSPTIAHVEALAQLLGYRLTLEKIERGT